MEKIDPTTRKKLSAWGKLGGEKTKNTQDKEYFSEIGRKGLEKRWAAYRLRKAEAEETAKQITQYRD